MSRRPRLLVLFAGPPGSETLSYQREWPRQFALHPAFDCTLVNVAWASTLPARAVRRLRGRPWPSGRYDAIVLLHSVFANSRLLNVRETAALRELGAPVVFFAGNEYKLMPEKMAFAEELGTKLLVSEILAPDVHALYRARLGCDVIGLPKGIDPDVFFPAKARGERPLDLGYRSHDSPWYLGHNERQELIRAFEPAAARRGLRTDLSLDPAKRLDTEGWAAFLNDCKGQIGSEASGDFFELTDETRKTVIAYRREHPDATFDELHATFFAGRPQGPSARVLSGRVVEAAATKTTQLLLVGAYGGLFERDVHYIGVEKDFSNVGDALDRLADETLAGEIAERAYELTMTELTYERLLRRFAAALEALLS